MYMKNIIKMYNFYVHLIDCKNKTLIWDCLPVGVYFSINKFVLVINLHYFNEFLLSQSVSYFET